MKKARSLISNLRFNRRTILFAGFIISFYLLILIIFKRYHISREQIEAVLAPLGVWGVLAAMGIQILTSMTPIPDAPLAFVTMVLYGPYTGSLAIFLGMLVATAANYYIAQKLGRKIILNKFPETHKFLKNFGVNASLETLVFFRFFSFVTFDIIAYIASLAHVPFWKFFLSSIIGLIPMIVSYALISQGLFSNNPIEIVLSWVIPAIVTFTITTLAKKRKTVNTDI